MRKNEEADILKYFVMNNPDDAWGCITTVGFERMKTRDDDPILAMHPSDYRFKSNKGRILNEYQLVYITEGKGVFKSASYGTTQVNAGTMFLLFPGEWHSYYPDNRIGWKAYWIGFTGSIIDKKVSTGYFSPKECICNMGINETIINLYNEAIQIATDNKLGSQQYISSIAQHILGLYYYKNLNHIENYNARIINNLNKALIVMRDNNSKDMSLEEMAKDLGLGYTWFRRMFRKYQGISPAQYQIQLRIIKIKELLTTSDLSISEIAYQIGFESKSQLSTFFKKYEGVSPSDFRKTNQ